MGQKVNPTGLRLGIVKNWDSRWFFPKDKVPNLIQEDSLIRKYISKRLKNASVARVEIERTVKRVTITVHTARPGVVIGRGGQEIDSLSEELQRITGKQIQIHIKEIKRPEVESKLVADNIAMQLEKRISFRRAMKKAISSAMRLGAQGIKIQCGGRLGGAEIARSEKYKDGRVPLHTLRADIDYAVSTARTTFGCIGIKVWIFKGEIIARKKEEDTI